MKRIFAAICALSIAVPAGAQDDATSQADLMIEREASATDLDSFLWVNRPLVVFADTDADPRFNEQMELLRANTAALVDRDVVIITDTDPSSRSAIRTKLRPRGFSLVLIGKDGGVKLRKPFPWDIRELSRVIDKMPLRQQEIRNGS